MAVWTISAALGAGGREVAEALAAGAGVPLYDRHALAELLHELEPEVSGIDDVDRLEERVGGRLNALALSAAILAGATDAFHELQLRQTLPELGRTVLREAAARPAVIFAPGAFAALRDHPAAVHVRLTAPFGWRVDSHARDELVDHATAERAVRHDDHCKRTWVKRLYGLDLADPALFALVADSSRIPRERLVELLRAAG
jgi:hypothetical protein